MYFKKYLIEILLGVNIILVLGIYGLYFYEKYTCCVSDSNLSLDENIDNNETLEESIAIVSEQPDDNVAEEKYNIEIKGQVTKPGVYSLLSGSIINDAIKKAGGFSKNAYTDNINLSKKISDELLIYVYSKDEYLSKNDTSKETTTTKEVCVCPSYEVTSCIEENASVIVSSESLTEETDNESAIININTASIEMLKSLNGIGDAKAKNIIEYRTLNGDFKSIDEILKVSGISDAIYEKIKDYITV